MAEQSTQEQAAKTVKATAPKSAAPATKRTRKQKEKVVASKKARVGRSSSKEKAALDPLAKPAGFSIVGIGASAGGLDALKRFFPKIPKNSGLAFVVVVHLAPEHKSHLADLLQPYSKLPVQQVKASVALRPDRVYVIPPNANLDTIDTHLRLSPLEERRIERAPIDHFFRTLARTHGGEAIGVVLTGTGSDGTLGLREIKAQGGLTLAQDPNDAEFNGMPQSAVASGVVDLVLPLDRIAETVLGLTRIAPRLPHVSESEMAEAKAERAMQSVFQQLRMRTDRDFSRYKRPTVLRRIQRRMHLCQIEEFSDYVEFIRSDASETQALADDLLITVTNFFRDEDVFAYLAKATLPPMFDRAKPQDEIRVWSVGCSTGEEAYSLAILLLEEAARRETSPRLQVFASDLHERSLKTAREGFYPADIETDVSAERLKRYFVKESGGYRVRKEVRQLVVFAPHNLMGDPPFSRIDLISCRNLLIYIQRSAQSDVIELFHYALRPGGYLALGSSETLEASDLFTVADERRRVVQKRNVPGPEPRLPVFPMTARRHAGSASSSFDSDETVPYGLLHQRMAERYALPSVLVSPDDKIVHLSEHVGRYLAQPGGEPTTNVIKLAPEALRIELRAKLHAARDRKKPSRSKPIPVELDGRRVRITVLARPSQEPSQEGFVLVVFDEEEDEEAEPTLGAPLATEAGGASAATHRELEAELGLTRRRLQSIVEKYESSQEEMKAANEEMQSTNEELRSTLEELETSKEELQSMNEELQTVNQENRHKVEELDQLATDLQNLLVATDIATLFLDRELCIMRFTPKVEELFHIRMVDRGRPLSDLRHRLGYDELEDDAKGVLERLVPVEREVGDSAGHWYLIRLLPYRSSSDRIEGVVITFIDITTRKEAEERLRREKLEAEQIIASLPEPLIVLSSDLTVRAANAAYYERFRTSPQLIEGQKVYTLDGGQWDIVGLRRLLEDVLPHNQSFSGFEVEKSCPGVGVRYMLINARRLDRQDLILLGIYDITELKRAEEALRKHELRFRSLLEQVKDYAIFMLDAKRRGTSWNEGVQRLLGFTEEEFLGKDVTKRIFLEEDLAAGVPEAEFDQARQTGSGNNDRWMRRKDGSRFWASGITTALRNDAGELVGFMKVMRDLTERKRLEEDLKRVAEELAYANSKKDEFLAMLAHELRNPLAPIRTGLELLKMSENKESTLEEVHGMLERQTEQLVTLVDDLLDVSRITRGKLKLRKRRVDAADIARSSVEGSKPYIDAARHELTVELPVEPIYLDADPHRIEQALLNLLNNAAKYTPEGGRIRLTLARQADDAVFTVTDSGVGIPKDRLEDVFTIFTQIDNPDERSGGGLGIGLTLVRSLVELHGGSVGVSSPGVGQGCVFHIRLPVATSVSGEIAAPPAAPPEVKAERKKILIVDDNVSAARVLSLAMSMIGHEVRTAHDGVTAVQTVESYQPDVVVMDIGMPNVDGHEAARRIRQQPGGQAVKLIALSGWGSENNKLESKRAGFDHHLVKPPNLSELRELIDE